ncbi:hypothetical protein F3Y22_tig00110402pilonHSYRG00193 [Hibiscus syriacus]|uniref:Uncharacterized protein n=1 Tax=Hibiscus syriacus TaxID=106335 RepID=A0A6A3ANZ2_HIBSY|nr:hypothetical protein F3Y22_tig00110402pilonHSYRG00193 [Hibiscus syriacus]
MCFHASASGENSEPGEAYLGNVSQVTMSRQLMKDVPESGEGKLEDNVDSKPDEKEKFGMRTSQSRSCRNISCFVLV